MTDKDVGNKQNQDLIPNEIEQLAKAMESHSSSWLVDKSVEEKDEFSLVTDVAIAAHSQNTKGENTVKPESQMTSIKSQNTMVDEIPDLDTEEFRQSVIQQSRNEAKRIDELAEELASKDRRGSPKKHQEFMSEEESLSRQARSKDRVLIPTVHKEQEDKKSRKKSSAATPPQVNALIPRLAKGKDSFSKGRGTSSRSVVALWFLGLSYAVLLIGAGYGHGNQVLDNAFEKLSLYGVDIPDPRDYELINPFSETTKDSASSDPLPAIIFVDPIASDSISTSSELAPENSVGDDFPPEQSGTTDAPASPLVAEYDELSTLGPSSKTGPEVSSKFQKEPPSLESVPISTATTSSNLPLDPNRVTQPLPAEKICRTWENLDSASAELLTGNLNKMRAKYSRSEKEQPRFYVVGIHPSQVPLDYIQSLPNKGVKETFRMKEEGPLKNFLSLGQFKFKSSAVQHKQNLERQGIEFLTIAGHKVNKLTTFKTKLDPIEFSKLPPTMRRLASKDC